MNLISKFEAFRRTHVSPNPGQESELTQFTQSLAERDELKDFTDLDWLELSRNLGLDDDQYAALLEGTATWLVKEPAQITDQKAADWPDELPAEARTSSRITPNPARATRGISPKQARRGTPEFDDLMADLEDEWELDDDELDEIVEIRRAGDEFEVRYKGETRWELIEEEGDDEDEVAGPDEDFGGEEE